VTTREFLSRYRWLPAKPDDRLDWIVMAGGLWMAYTVAMVMDLIWGR
jgi:hypothetical protein